MEQAFEINDGGNAKNEQNGGDNHQHFFDT
jgi:hypothetical protein